MKHKKVKLLIIATTKFDLDGITHSVMNYYRYMDKSNMEIDFVIPNKINERLRKEIESNNGEIFELLLRNKKPLLYFRELKRIISKKKYDIVHAHGNSCTLAVEMLAAKQAGVKVRISHSRNSMCKHKLIHKLLRPVFNFTYTHGFACGYQAGRWLFQSDNFTVVNNGNDVEKFSYNEEIRQIYREKYNLEGKKVIGHVGAFNYQKNHDFLIGIIEHLVKRSPEYVLFLVGDGYTRKEVEKKIQRKGLSNNVIFTGKSLEVEKLIQAMDIMVLPSRYEGLPNVVIEWQIACLPSIISDNVTQEVQLTDLVEFLPLEAGEAAWVKKISEIEMIDRQRVKKQVIHEITEAGFNVKENAKHLKEHYFKLVQT
ncbi:glycosyltransferase family 1 protein [Alkalicoccus luteus]|uniref:glycosyltransferase family 1 protein n=1 Tax=Alkalicoccus luteus TaxID=1237094 RepID=UPI0040337F6A